MHLARRSSRLARAALAATVALLAGFAAGSDAGAATRPAGLYVAGARLVSATGAPLILRGVNHSGSEYACAQGWGIFDGPTDAASVRAMAGWHVHVVRVPLNEDCWLGINGVRPAYGGSSYRTAIAHYVAALESAGMSVILDLHWNAPGRRLATGQQVMADADHSPALWRSVATAYKKDHRVLFELYNEPHDISWSCWKNGCTTSDGWKTAGMQTLLSAVRSTGARNVVLVGGLAWSSDLSQWLRYAPRDPAAQLAATFHGYNFGGCHTSSCWSATIASVARKVPVVATEFGENDCTGRFVSPLMSWFDTHRVSYLAWTWNTWDCRSGPALITDVHGTPTAFGAVVRTHLRSH